MGFISVQLEARNQRVEVGWDQGLQLQPDGQGAGFP